MNQIKVSEARKKACPFMVDVVMQDARSTSGMSYPRNICCITSACMAWAYTTQYHFEYVHKKPDDNYIKVEGYHNGYSGTVWQKELPEEDKLGKCLRLATQND